MQPLVMLGMFIIAFGAFGYTLLGRWRLLRVGPWDLQFDQTGERMGRMFKFAIGQWRMPRHFIAGVAHIFIYLGAVIMLLRALIVFARGFVSDPHFGYWLFDTGTPLGDLYSLIKDIFVVLVLLGILVFLYYRVIRYLPRLNLNFEGILILMILSGLMISDVIYDGATIARYDDGHASIWEPLGSLAATQMRNMSAHSLVFWQHFGFWAHVGLILGFMNYLPYCKQFHEMTAFFNVYFQPLGPAGRLPNIEDIEGKVEREETLGVRRIDQFGAKAFLDFFTCTECGRCTDQCPANNTGKKLAPNVLTRDLRDFGYQHQCVLGAGGNGDGKVDEANPLPHQIDLVGPVVDPEVLWACTTCRACEQECPVFISYVDKIVALRRHLVMERGEFPQELQNAFRGLETVGNVYSFANEQRADWAKGLDVPLMAEKQEVDVLYWVGCAPSFDDRSKKVAQAFARLMKQAGVDFAILGPEETCTGDAARRAGNEYLFQMYAQQNCEVLNTYKFNRIVTTCPHCFNTLANEYSDFGGHYTVVHHSDFLLELVKAGKLKPTRPVVGTVAYHDSCYLGRYNDIYNSPRELLRAIPGLKLVEPTETGDRGMCCGAGGAQMWKEEEPGNEKIYQRRIKQMLKPLPSCDSSCTVASACPFCMTMLSDGLKDLEYEEVQQLDLAELLWKSAGVEEATVAEQASS